MDGERSGSWGHGAKPLALLARLATDVPAALDTTQLVDAVLATLLDEAGFGSCTVGLVNETLDAIRLVGAAGIRATDKGLDIPRGRGLDWTVVESGEPLYVPDMLDDARVWRQHAGVRSGIYAPLVIRRGVIGAVSAHRTGVDGFTSDDLDVLTVIAQYLAAAFEVTRLHDQLREAPASNALPRLPNRRCITVPRRAGRHRARRLR